MKFSAVLLAALVAVLAIATIVPAEDAAGVDRSSNGINPHLPTISIDIQREKKPGFFSRTFRSAGRLIKKITNRRRTDGQYYVMHDPYRGGQVWVHPHPPPPPLYPAFRPA